VFSGRSRPILKCWYSGFILGNVSVPASGSCSIKVLTTTGASARLLPVSRFAVYLDRFMLGNVSVPLQEVVRD
jgi:hypothetical protein